MRPCESRTTDAGALLVLSRLAVVVLRGALFGVDDVFERDFFDDSLLRE